VSAQDTLPLPEAEHSSPEHDELPDAVAEKEILDSRNAFRASTHCPTSVAFR
jgi:hypothetical protein